MSRDAHDLEAREAQDAEGREAQDAEGREAQDAEALEPEGPDDGQALLLDPEVEERRRQALALVRRFGDPVLRSPASPITRFGPELAAEAERMTAIMRDALGVGLAATQLGLMRRMLVFQAGPDAPATALVNPELEWVAEDRLEVAEEGCLSLPGIVVEVERPLHVRVSGVDPAGESLRLEASGLEARVLQHEIDHLDGVLMIDRAERDQRRGALRALREGTGFAPATDPAEAVTAERVRG